MNYSKVCLISLLSSLLVLPVKAETELNSIISSKQQTQRQAQKTQQQIIALDEKRRKTQAELDNTLAESNKLSKEIGMLYKSGKVEEANAKKAGRLSCRFVAALMALPAITDVSGIGSSLLVVYHEKFFIFKAAGTIQI